MLGACTTSPSRQILVVPMRAPRLPIGLSGIGLANRTWKYRLDLLVMLWTTDVNERWRNTGSPSCTIRRQQHFLHLVSPIIVWSFSSIVSHFPQLLLSASFYYPLIQPPPVAASASAELQLESSFPPGVRSRHASYSRIKGIQTATILHPPTSQHQIHWTKTCK